MFRNQQGFGTHLFITRRLVAVRWRSAVYGLCSFASGGELSLEEAIELSAASITEKLPKSTRVAIVAFEAEHKNVADYVMDELVGGSLEVAARNNLSYVLKEHTQAIELDPNDAAAYSNRGAVYYNKGDYDRAIADYTQAVKLDPNDRSYKNNLEIAKRRGR